MSHVIRMDESCNAYADHESVRSCFRSPSAIEPSFAEKKPCISMKEPHISTKETYISTKEPDITAEKS